MYFTCDMYGMWSAGVYSSKGAVGLTGAIMEGTHCLCKAGHLLSWFCFPSSQWAPDPSCKQREFKNCSASCVPKCSEGRDELERWQLGYPAGLP